ncbi:arylsulfatase [Flavobacterium tyrosinilyticum]|uniref:arylsulfatase n=1 Tax=Flavobacterium tyrosinilyticum TaxID=1658740 RepID=UPI00202E11E4|nr:arylsulfatase [Flavobacterium tyrosinilyticum]MCM0667689.1 arylsulfatase [Flavobacterium tyrosinilyticum]
MKAKSIYPLLFILCISAITIAQNPPADFKGDIKLDIRDSKPDWDAFLYSKAPKDSPNVLFILYDDTGQATWSPYGGRVNMPVLDGLAADGLTYTQWHTTSVCSPTRSTLLTGRNHHQNGYGTIAESAAGYPGYSGHIPQSNATIATILRDAGYSTFWIGKNHNVPVDAFGMGASKKDWPLGQGFDRYYGFIGGETNQWYPALTEDNHAIDQPYLPDQGYHLSKDLADKAIQYISDSKQASPDKPWYMWYCPGANHAPHHAPKEYIDKYKGKFDDGYEAYRDWVLKRMIDKGVLPKDTKLTPENPMPEGTFAEQDMVRPWNTLSAEEKKLFSHMAEVFAGYSEYTDAQIGRVIKYLKESGQYENTLILYAADNGASGEGSPNGSVNENYFFNSYPDDVKDNIAKINKLGTVDSYNHYPTGWAMAFSAPYKMYKRYSGYSGGTCDPLVICWPKGIKARGEMRSQYYHSTDIVPTILEACGVKMPEYVNGIKQTPLAGVSMISSFKDANAPTQKKVQYYEMLGTRGIWKEGWIATAVHGPLPSNIGNFDKDKWELYHTDIDRSQSNDLASQYPEKVKEMKKLWMDEAKKNNVLPLNDLSILEFVKIEYYVAVPPDGKYTYYPNTNSVPEANAASTTGRSFKIFAEVDLKSEAKGVIVSQGSRFGGYSLYLKDKKINFEYNFLGLDPLQKLSYAMPAGKHIIGVEFVKEKMSPKAECLGTMKLYIDYKVVAQAPFRTQPHRYSLNSGEGLAVGYDVGDPVSKNYGYKFPFAGGTIKKVTFDVSNDQYIDVEKEFQRKMKTE